MLVNFGFKWLKSVYRKSNSIILKNIMIAFQARIFLFVDLREFFTDLGSGDEKKLKMTS